ncbi:uncharacterized protein METZ01_LOCUS507566, partial [marine metagenome]
EVAGIPFANPVGMAAGFDKNGRIIEALAAMGLGFVEIGSISAHPSEGNPRPRLFRLPRDEAIVVNYGVPNEGSDAVAHRVDACPTPMPLGINLVETNTGGATEPEHVIAELTAAAKPFRARADYIALNLNCPNTTGGESPYLQPRRVAELLSEYQGINALPPVFLKFTAHADPHRIDAMLEAVEPSTFIAGFIFNLPPGLHYPLRTPSSVSDSMPGTLCGRPVRSLIDDAT